ncbi:hect E3 ubiquitin ligase [Culex quinquefasciatus]|uniref:Hect E3 ubiquitin ligase n=1 Tax=Culex quinquefasciatus TaxID=7176 RepID=B0XGI2_CULQU|nr:hect E3 ubiquitin ligase [Culex quinquefasciatus]|eukprot:XP_001868754.1 hect E3 ubiquitin ligase [Culex quinquefasciatus]
MRKIWQSTYTMVQKLEELIKQKQHIDQNDDLSLEKLLQISELSFNTKTGSMALEDLVLTFTYLRSSNFYGYQSVDLIPNGANTSWVKFFTNAGVPSQAAAEYAHVFVENRFQMDMLMDLNKEYLHGHHDDGEIIAILCHSKTVCNQCARDRVLSSQSAVVEGSVLPEHLAYLVPVAAVSATLEQPTQIGGVPLAVSLPSKSQKHYLEHKIKPPDGGESTTNIVRIINECSDNKASLVSTVGSLGRRSAVYERLEHNSNDGEKEDGELKDDIDDAGNGRELPKKMASKVTLKDIEALGKKSDSFGGGGGSIFSRLGEKSNQRESKNVVPVKKIPAKVVTADLRQCSSKIYSDEEDIDGMPLVTTEDIDCVPMQSSEKKLRTSHPSGKRSRPQKPEQARSVYFTGLNQQQVHPSSSVS